MQKNLIQAAIDGGEFVLVPTPANRVPTAPPLHNKDKLAAALRLMFKLSPTESVVLADLTIQGYVHITDPAIPGIMRVYIYELRKKLPHDISTQIATIVGFGYTLHKAGREKVRRLLVKHDAGLIPTVRSRPKTKTSTPNLFAETNT